MPMLQKASLRDVHAIHRLINAFAQRKMMLPRSLNYVYERVREFWVYTKRNKVIGCCALSIVGWQDLAEIKSLAVDGHYQGQGIGRVLLEACIEEAKGLGVKKVFALTYEPVFFKKSGFKPIKKEKLPHKIWADCLNCPEFPKCKEEALVKKVT